MGLDRLTIKGFKSIESLDDFALDRLTVLIGANGSGKSNFVDFFRLLRAIFEDGLQHFVQRQGGGDGFFFLGPKYTRMISALLQFTEGVYEFDLEPTADGKLLISEQRGQYTGDKGVGYGQFFVCSAVSSCVVYHFHDTSPLAPMRREWSVRDFERLRPEAENIAAYLLHLRDTSNGRYKLLLDIIRLVAPFLDDFVLRPETKGENEVIRLEWRQKGSDFPFQPSQLSDGTIRFICLATALNQIKPPSIIVIDEPELGLHPHAIGILADLISSAAEQTQIVVATQSPILLDYFDPKSVVVANRREGRSVFERLDSDMLREWLDEYSLGELWQKNVVQGGATNE